MLLTTLLFLLLLLLLFLLLLLLLLLLQPAAWSFPCRVVWGRRHSLVMSAAALLRSLEEFLLHFEDLKINHKQNQNKNLLLARV